MEEDGETVSVDGSGRPADGHECRPIRDPCKGLSCGKAEPKKSDALLQELAQDLTSSEKTSPSIHEGLACIF